VGSSKEAEEIGGPENHSCQGGKEVRSASQSGKEDNSDR
jgi:hypothetical protein